MYSGELTKTPLQKALPRHLGLIVGINQYQDRTFSPLQFAENDARALAQWLVNNKGGKWSPPDVQLVQGQHATRELIESLITQICIQQAEEGDAILLYFAGHTFIDEHSGEGYLAFTNSQYQDPTTCLSLLSFAQHVLTRSRASQILCIFDCFQTGQIWNMRRTSAYDSKPLLGSSVLNILQSQPNRLFMCSCRGNDRVRESGERGIGQLVHGMVLGFCGPAIDPATGTVSLTKLHAYLFGSLDEQHRPQLFGQQQTPFILVGDLPASTAEISEPPTNPPTAGAPWMSASGPATSGLLKKNVQNAAMGAAMSSPVLPPMAAGNTQAAEREQQNQQLLAQAQTLFDAQNYGEAFNLVEQILQASPNDLPALILKGQLLGTAGRYPEAQSTIEHILQLDPNSAIGWSMRAVVLSNIGQHQMALEAVERSLELDAQNPETYAIKNNITGNLAMTQSQAGHNNPAQQRQPAAVAPTSFGRALMAGAGWSLLGIILGLVGIALLIFIPSIPYVGLFVTSIALAISCVSTARGSFRNGFAVVLEVAFFSAIITALVGGTVVLKREALFAQLSARPSLFQPLIALGAWLIALAAIPFILAVLGFLIGLPARSRRKNS